MRTINRPLKKPIFFKDEPLFSQFVKAQIPLCG